MKVNKIQGYLIAVIFILTVYVVSDVAVAEPRASQHNGQKLLGGRIKTNGNHKIHKKGDYSTSVEVKDEKIEGLHVQHAKKGDVPVKKYKTNKKLAQADKSLYPWVLLAQNQYLGTTCVGYSYVDECGNEEIYWFPNDMILDGDTGAVEYVPEA